jgi:hypothetical protein
MNGPNSESQLQTLIRARARADQRSKIAIRKAARDMRLAAELNERIEALRAQVPFGALNRAAPRRMSRDVGAS